MFINWKAVRIYIKIGHTDMRKQINGLSLIIQEELELNPFEQNIFIFCNKRRNRMKLLYWDRNGFCLWLKRLEQDKFPWPKGTEEAKEITVKELKMLLDGIDFWHAHKVLQYSEIS